MNLNLNNLVIKKPSFYFIFTTILCFITLLFIGDTTWRHIDDYGPLKNLDDADSIYKYLRLFTVGWGTYPPIWQYFTFFSYIFKFFGLDVVRFICFLYGFLSILISSILTYSICLSIKNFNIVKPKFSHNYFLEILSILVNVLNPEIILHSNSNMPYNLASISIQIIILLIFNIIKKDKNQYNKNEYIIINKDYFILITIFSILITFQSTIIILGFCLTLFIYFFINKIKININSIHEIKPILIYRSYKNLFKYISNKYFKYILFITFTCFVLAYIFKLLLIVFYFQKQPGSWSNGINEIYKISNLLHNPLDTFSKIIFNLKSIITQSLYPFRSFQVEVSNLIFIVYIFNFILLIQRNLAGRYFSVFSFFTILITILLSSFGNFIFAPTRHTIFLYPLFWIPLIANLDYLFEKFRNKLISNIFLISLFCIFSFGCFSSIKAISYSKENNIKLLNLLKNSDFYIEESYWPFSDISFNGTKEYKLTKNKKCSVKKISKKDQYKIFIYNHRYPFVSDEIQLDNLFNNNKECFNKNYSFSVLDQIEIENYKDIEQNNFIFNGGSSLYAYLIKVEKFR